MKIVKFFSILILALAFVLQMSVIVPGGSQFCAGSQCGIFFWGAHEHDSVWHLAVSETLFQNFPFQMPNMSGTLMHGYNYLYDIVIATLSSVSGIGDSFWFFKILPIAWFAIISYLLFRFAQTYRKSKTFPLFLWFFSFFGSSFSYLLKIRNGQTLWGASSLLSMQSLQDMLNPQFAWSLIPLLLFLIGINESKRTYTDYVKYGIYVAIAIGLKFYTGAGLLILIAADLFITMSREKKEIVPLFMKGLLVLVLSAVSVLIFYSPGTSTGFPFMFRPLATVNPIIEDKSLFYLPKWAERLYSYQGLKLAILEAGVLVIFVLLNFGTRILGLFGFITHDNLSTNYTRNLIVIGSVSTFLLSILLTQRGVWWNTVQFLYVSLFLSGILAAEGIDMLVKSKKMGAYILAGIFILLTIPTNLDVVHTFARFPGTGYIASEEVEALRKLHAYPAGVILTPLFATRAQVGLIPDIGRAYDTAYVSAYSGKKTYLTDLIQLELTNVSYRDRVDMVGRYDCQILREVDYIYEYQGSQFVNQFSQCGVKLDRIIENNSVSIYSVNK